MREKKTIIIPAYEPPDSFIEYSASLLQNPGLELLVIDDGSGEAYRPVFDAIAALDRATVLHHTVNCGKGAAIKTALTYCKEHGARDGLFTVADCDGQHKAEDVLRVLAAVEKNPDALVLGVRDFGHPSVPKRSRRGNRIMMQLFRALYGAKYQDTQTGLRGFSYGLIPFLLSVKGNRFEYETNMLVCVHKEHVPFLEVPISTIYAEPENHVSHFKTFSDSVKVMRVLFSNIGVYFLSSAVSALVDVIAFFILSRYAFIHMERGLGLLLATVSARLLSSVFNFYGNCRYVFRGSGRRSIARYYLLWTVQLSVSYGFTYLMGRLIPPGIWLSLLKGLFDLFLAIFSYKIQRHWVFAPHVTNREKFFGFYFHMVRFFASPFLKKYKTDLKKPEEPCVFVCRHLDLHGPLTLARSLPFDTHFMVLHCFFHFKECYRQFADYTFSVRKKVKGPGVVFARIKAFFAAVALPPLIRAMHAVPVYRGDDGRTVTTVRNAAAMLDQGGCVTVFPDVAYTSRSEKAGEIYQGFLMTERLYFRKHGKHLPFVVLHLDEESKRILASEPLYFSDTLSQSENIAALTEKIRELL